MDKQFKIKVLTTRSHEKTTGLFYKVHKCNCTNSNDCNSPYLTSTRSVVEHLLFFVDCKKGCIDEVNEKETILSQTIFLVWETLLSSRVQQSTAEVRA